MRAAIIDFGHVDSVVSLARYLSEKIEVDLYLTFDQKFKYTSIINFQDLATPSGLIENDLVRKIIGNEIISYLGEKVKCRVFIFNSPSLKDPQNYFLLKKFTNFLKQQKYDVVHFNGNHLLESLFHYYLRKIPRVHTLHDAVAHTGEGSWKFRLRSKFLENLDINFILPSEFSVRQLKENYNFKSKKIHSVYFGPLEVYKSFSLNGYEEKKNKNNILFYGRISPYKGIEYLVDAFRISSKKTDNLSLTIAGKGDFYFNIDNIKNNSSVAIINRYISNEELVQLIHNSDLIVCPYTDASQSGVIMTAFAFNKPVIATRVGGMIEVVEENVNGKLVPPKNSQALSEAIVELFQNNMLNELSMNLKNGRYSDKLSWKRIAEKTIGIYQSAINEKKEANK